MKSTNLSKNKVARYKTNHDMSFPTAVAFFHDTDKICTKRSSSERDVAVNGEVENDATI